MNDLELFEEISKAADAGEVRNITYTPLPRGLHKFTIKSSKLTKREDTSRFVEFVAEVTDETPEKGTDFRISQMIITKDGKKIAAGIALAAGLFKAAKDMQRTPNANGTGLEGVVGEAWLDVDSYAKGDKTYFNQQLYWGTEEPPKTSKATTPSAAATADAPF